MNRKTALLEWSKKKLEDENCYIEPASSDASFRSYWRAFSHSKTFVVMDAPPEHENCLPFINISKKLIDSGISAPEVIHKDLHQGFLMLTDLGKTQYLQIINHDNYKSLYNDALSALLTLQQKTTQTDLSFYDESLLLSEMQLFDSWFINKHLGIELTQSQKTTIQNCQKILIKNALEQPQTFVHRDYHSRNLMYNKNQNPGILDFQDALIGPVTYDLVSLLKDCYVSWDENEVNLMSNQFRQQYNQINNTNISSQIWQKWFDLMGVQRHLKAVGIFCRLNYRDNKPNYLKDINRTINYIKLVCNQYSELSAFLTVINSIIPSIKNP